MLSWKFNPPLDENRSSDDYARIYRPRPWYPKELEVYAGFRPGEPLPFVHYDHERGLPILPSDILAEGEYKLIVKRKGYAPVEMEFTIAAGQTTKLNVKFKPE